jgi:thiamine pyrophosphate-dependent acetolactate synthase large subunit-like protein
MLNSPNGWIMQVREAFCRFLAVKGIKTIFHLPGIHTLPLNDVLLHSTIRVISARHEANAAFMADGFSRATGNVGVVLVTPGPGLGNIMSSCMEAFGEDIPLLITFVDTDRRGRKEGGLHDIGEPRTMFAGISKGIFAVSDENDFWTVLERAHDTAISPRRGPVIVSIPYRLLQRECLVDVEDRGQSTLQQGRVFDVGPLVLVGTGAERPVILAGKALEQSDGREELLALCERARIPFLVSTSGKGILPDDHPSSFGNISSAGTARKILSESDLVIALGTRLRKADTKDRGVRFNKGPLVHIDVDDRWLNKNYQAKLTMVGDMNLAVRGLSALWQSKQFSWDLEALARLRESEIARLEATEEGMKVTRLLRSIVPPETMTVWDPTLLGYWAEEWFPLFRERMFLYPGGTSTIFYALPASIGAKIGHPEHPCLCVTGDGSFLATAGELSTISTYKVPVVILIYNNKSLGVLEHFMRGRHRVENTMALENPDFVALARSFNIKAKRVEDFGALERVFRHDITWEEPFVVELAYPRISPPWQS